MWTVRGTDRLGAKYEMIVSDLPSVMAFVQKEELVNFHCEFYGWVDKKLVEFR